MFRGPRRGKPDRVGSHHVMMSDGLVQLLEESLLHIGRQGPA